MRNKLFHILVNSFLLTILALAVATPALAFDGRGGDNIVIGAGEVINDDLYVGAENFTLDGTVKGDLVVGGSVITINGTVEGDLIAAGQAVIINGTVGDDVRVAAGAVLVGENAKIGGDVVVVGGSLEARKGSSVGNDVIFGGGQALLAGEIIRNLKMAGGGLEMRGAVGGDVSVSTGDPEQSGPGPLVYLPNSPIPLPNVQPGLKIDPEAKIDGTLEYVSNREINFPGGVAARVKRIEPVVDPNRMVKQPTLVDNIVNGTLDMFRNMVTLILLGLLLVWLFPNFVKASVERIRTAPLPAFGWGIVSWAAFFFALMVIFVAMLFGGIFFGILTLGGLSATIIWLGVLSMFTLVVGFVLAAAVISKIVVAVLGGRLILSRIKPEWADHKVWPLVLGVIIFAILAAVPIFGGLVNIVVILFGLGALWLYGRDLLRNGRAVEQPVG
jgi:carbonic anhydrase/acetyltransferase-like protein (isoleucine patch superfamily)